MGERNGTEREMLVQYAHEAWSGWMRYMLPLLAPLMHVDLLATSEYPESVEALGRWQRQLRTGYDDLPEWEKESDRKEADQMLAIFRAARLEAPDGT